MNTFDVFDTLIARRYLTSDPIILQLANEVENSNFFEARKIADTGARSLQEIYTHLASAGIIPESHVSVLMNREIELEIQHAIPVQENINRVNHGDILISDMYLPASAILEMVRSTGMNKQVTLYQSNGDKSNGTVWPKLQRLLAGWKSHHLGDNKHSDVDMPASFGISAEWCPDATKLNASECKIVDDLTHIAMLSREVRLRYSGDRTIYHTIAASVNLPMLFVLAEQLHRKYKNRNIVFLGRDCQLLQKLYSAFYGLCYYLPFSRKVAYDQPEDSLKYLQAHSPNNPVYVDISSTGGTWEHLSRFGLINITVAIYSDSAYYTPTKPTLPMGFEYLMTNSQIGQTNLLLELFNCGDHGHLEMIKTDGDKLMEVGFGLPELPSEIVDAVHNPVKQACNLVTVYRDNIRQELSNLTDEQLVKYFAQLSSTICSETNLLSQAKGFLDKETHYLTQFTK